MQTGIMSALCCTPFFFACLVLENRCQVHITAGSGETVCVCVHVALRLYFLAFSSFLCVTVGPAHPLRIVAPSVMPSSKTTKTSQVTGISTTDYQSLPEEFGEHHGRHEVWVAEIPFIGLKTFTCDTCRLSVLLQELLNCNVSLHILAFSCLFFVFAR